MQRCINKILILIVLLMFSDHEVSCAQIRIQVVSKKITKTINWSAGMMLEIKAERAEIFCTTHSLSTIVIDVEFIAKNENRNIAEADLKKMKWLNETINKKVFLRNYIELSKGETKPFSDIKAVYHIKMPEGCALNINNYFGLTEISNVSHKLNITSEFGKIHLYNVRGNTTINTIFGDFSANSLSGNIYIVSKRSDIDIQNISGKVELHANLAEININGIIKNENIKIEAEKSKVFISTGDYNQYSFNFELYKADFNKPDEMQAVYSDNTAELIKGVFNKSKVLPLIDVKIKTGSLNIK